MAIIATVALMAVLARAAKRLEAVMSPAINYVIRFMASKYYWFKNIEIRFKEGEMDRRTDRRIARSS